MTADILDGLIRANLAGALAILAVFALRGPVRRTFGARVAYGLWALPLLLAAASLIPFPQGAVPALTLAPLPGQASRPIAPTAQQITLQALIVAIWGFGFVVSQAILAFRQARFVQGLGALTPDDVAGQRVFRASGAGAGPAVVGLRIVVPADFETSFTLEERAVILRHERTHLAHGDVAANALAALVQSLCWFNPLVHLAARQMRIDQELACDAVVIEALPASRRAYAEALLKTQIAVYAPPVGCLWPSRAEHPLKERIAMLKSPLPAASRRQAGAGLIAVLALAGGYAAWAAQPPAPPPVTQPDWLQRPTGEDVKRFYPPEALKNGREGMAVMSCTVTAQGTLAGCQVARAEPQAEGFGEAALQMSALFRMAPATRDGKPVAGAPVRIPIKFVIPDKTPPQ